jgi:hypothetical protein
MQPGGDLMEQAALSLSEALADATSAMGQIRSAEAEAFESKKKLQDCLLEIKQLRESDVTGQQAIAVLQEIAEMKKGASTRARDWLLSVSKMPPAKEVKA